MSRIAIIFLQENNIKIINYIYTGGIERVENSSTIDILDKISHEC